jgi:hypothetical protein
VEHALLARKPVELCGDCHDLADEAFSTAHLRIDPSIMNCAGCHAPHASSDRRLFQAVEHAPFAAEACEECHETP